MPETGQALGGMGRRLFYFILAGATFITFLPIIQAQGSRFGAVRIRYSGFEEIVYIISFFILLILTSLFLYQSKHRFSALKILALALVGVGVLTFTASRFLTLIGILYFTPIWHFFLWHIFYVWKLWQRSRSISPLPSFSVISPEQPLNKFLAYATSGPLPFLLISVLFAIPVVGYAALDYDGSIPSLFSHPFYGQFAMFIWAIPHITLSFVFRR